MDRPILKIESGQTKPPSTPWIERETGLPKIMRDLGQQASESNVIFGAPPPGTPRESSTLPQLISSFFTGRPTETVGGTDFSTDMLPETDRAASAALRARVGGTQYPMPEAPAQEETTRQDVLNQIMAELGLLGGGGGGAVRPDYSAYRAALTDQAQQLNAQIQAMYNQLAGQAGENVGRIQDIYGGATAGIEAGYGSAAENIAQAYESAQQQAAEQMARLGIEEAAQQVLPSQALSQAEAVAGLEAGRAGGLSAAERYGASGAQFGSEMAQVAQQQGTEMNAAILASLQNRLAESLAAEQAGVSGGGGGGMSVSDMLRLQEYADEVYRRDVLGELPIEEQRRAVEMAAEEEQGLREERATLNYRAAQLATDLAPMNASPEEMQQAYELALSMLSR